MKKLGFKLQNCKTAKLQNCKTAKLALYGIAIIPLLSYAEQQKVVEQLAPIVVNSTSSSSFTVTPTEVVGSYNIPKLSGSTGLSLSAKETPQSVSVVTYQQMRDRNANTIDKALKNAQGVSVRATDRGRNSFSARGFSIDRYEVDGLPVDWNGAWVTGENSMDMVLFDRVEVVRGSNGLTTGSGNPSAGLNFVRKTASSPTRYTILETGIGRYGDWNGLIDHSQPLNSDGTVRSRFIVSHQGGKTFVDREKSQQNTFYANVEADLGDRSKVSLGISHQRNDKDGAMWGGLPAFYDDNSQTDWDVSKSASVNWSYWDTRTTNYFLNFDYKLADDWKLALKSNYREAHSNSKLFYFSGSKVNRVDGLGWGAWPGLFHTDANQLDLSLQLEGKFKAWNQTHDLVFGIQHSDQKRKSTQADFTNAATVTNFFNWDGSYAEPIWGASSVKYNQRIKEHGYYAATRLHLTDNFSVLLGSRFSKYKSEGTSYGSSLNYKTKTVWTPYAGLVLDVTPNNSLYVSYTDIFKPQQYRDTSGKLLEPIKGKSYELGWKGSFLENRLDTQVSIFKTVQDNLAQANGVIAGTTPPETAYYAAKGATVKGFELEAIGSITDDLKLTVGYTQWKGKDAQGKAINTTHPRKQFKLFASYDLSKLVKGLIFGAGVNWQSKIYTENNGVKWGQSSYALVDLMARYQFNDNLSIQVNLDNLFNKKYRNQLGFGQYNYGEPRYIRANIRYEF